MSANEIIIKLHYHRPDGNYDDWSVWLWTEGKEGSDYPFGTVVDEYGVVATASFPIGTETIGFIVRTSEWVKDYEFDRFIDLTNYYAGTVDVYVKSGEFSYHYDLD